MLDEEVERLKKIAIKTEDIEDFCNNKLKRSTYNDHKSYIRNKLSNPIIKYDVSIVLGRKKNHLLYL